ncbi:hypothetical protein EK21DRAFT_106577 [Setomelanomma holmii]|uniref:Uncharacterized protein n=1 Tax=Setomelanomma holmii TaxID=210430 RepID=A0A9P4LUG4_9PLEO|nr:hypothetical protein EK21DRAFT_106577 [Setomelanomma holmii]
MLYATSARLGVIVVILMLQIIDVAIEVLYLSNKSANKSPSGLHASLYLKWIKIVPSKNGFWPTTHRSRISHCVLPVLFASIGVILACVTFSGQPHANVALNQCNHNFDANVSGDGVRSSIWTQACVLILISVIGIFHNNDTGIKEVKGGLILTHASLAIALMVQMIRESLRSVDAAMGSVILDAQNTALQIPLAAKESLAARWQVLILIPTEILGLVLIPILVVRLTNGEFASGDCKCLYVCWWTWLSDCSAFHSRELSAFWTYYTLPMNHVLSIYIPFSVKRCTVPSG